MNHVNKGFSLLELMIVIGIIGVISSIAVPNLRPQYYEDDGSGTANVNDAFDRLIKKPMKGWAAGIDYDEYYAKTSTIDRMISGIDAEEPAPQGGNVDWTKAEIHPDAIELTPQSGQNGRFRIRAPGLVMPCYAEITWRWDPTTNILTMSKRAYDDEYHDLLGEETRTMRLESFYALAILDTSSGDQEEFYPRLRFIVNGVKSDLTCKSPRNMSWHWEYNIDNSRDCDREFYIRKHKSDKYAKRLRGRY